MVELEEVIQTGMTLRERGYKRVTPHFIPKILINMAAGHVSIRHKLKVSFILRTHQYCIQLQVKWAQMFPNLRK